MAVGQAAGKKQEVTEQSFSILSLDQTWGSSLTSSLIEHGWRM